MFNENGEMLLEWVALAKSKANADIDFLVGILRKNWEKTSLDYAKWVSTRNSVYRHLAFLHLYSMAVEDELPMRIHSGKTIPGIM